MADLSIVKSEPLSIVKSEPLAAKNPVENAASHAMDRLSEIPGAIGDMVMHPIDTAGKIYDQQKQLAGEGVDAAKAGDIPLALSRGIETLMPGVGPAIASGFKTIKSGDTSGGIGDMIGAVGPALVAKGASISPKVQAFGRGAIDSATETAPTIHVGRLPIRVPVPLPAAGGLMGAEIGSRVGFPKTGAAIGAVAPLVRGGMKAASGEPWFPQASPTIPSLPAMPSNRLLNSGAFVMPPPEDGSFVRGVPGMYQPPNPARALTAAPNVTEMPAAGTVDPSFVRGVPAMTQPPNPARALPAAPRVLEMPAAADASYVRAVPGEFAPQAESQVISPDLEDTLQRSVADAANRPKPTPFSAQPSDPLRIPIRTRRR